MKPLLLIHIPKSAGTAVINSFDYQQRWRNDPVEANDLELSFDANKNLSFGHVDINEVRKRGLITDKEWNNYYKICFVRNPWDRVASLYEYLKTENISFESFIFNLRNADDIGYYNRRGFSQCQPQVKWIPEDIDYIGKIETIHSDIEKISQIINVDIPHPRKENVTIARDSKHYYEYFPNTRVGGFLREEVGEFYKEDIKRFNYSF